MVGPKNQGFSTKMFTVVTSLVVQHLRILLLMLETWVRSLVREDPACGGETKPVRRNYRAGALEPTCLNY